MFWYETIVLVVDATLNLENKSNADRFAEVCCLIFTYLDCMNCLSPRTFVILYCFQVIGCICIRLVLYDLLILIDTTLESMGTNYIYN